MKKEARVTVVMPCYNAEKYIAEALESLLRQTYQDFKILVIDDGSTDKSGEIIERYAQMDDRICPLYNRENRGQVYTRNRGLEKCNTEYIALMDADDVATEYRLEKEVKFLDKYPAVGAVGGEYDLISEEGRTLGKSKIRAFTERSVKAHLFFHNVLANSSMMFRSQIVRENGIRYLEEYRGSSIEDYCFWCMFSDYAMIVNLPYVLLKYRVVENGISRESRKKRIKVRNQAFDEIHFNMFKRNGFVLGANGSEFLQMFRDEFSCGSMKEWEMAFQCLISINRQSRIMNKSYKWELRRASIYFMLCLTKKLFMHFGKHYFQKRKNR